MIDVNRPAHEAILATLFHEVGHKTQLVLTAEQWGKFTNLITREYTRQVQVGETVDWHGFDTDSPGAHLRPIKQTPTVTPVHKLQTSSPAKAAIEHRFGQFLDKPGEFMAYTNQNKYSLKDVLDMAPDQLAEFIGGNEVVRDELWANFFRSGMFSPQFRMKTIAKLQALHPELPAAAIGNLWAYDEGCVDFCQVSRRRRVLRWYRSARIYHVP